MQSFETMSGQRMSGVSLEMHKFNLLVVGISSIVVETPGRIRRC